MSEAQKVDILSGGPLREFLFKVLVIGDYGVG